MMNTFVFDFFDGKPAEGKIPYSPFAYIKVGDLNLSPQIMTLQELDYCIDLLVKELERVRREGKRVFG